MSLLPLILGLLAAFAPLAIDMYLPALPEMAMALGSDSGGAQLTIASYFVGMGLGQLIYGPLTDRFGRRPPLFVGVGLFLLASLACALAQTLPQMVALRFVQALGGCAGMVVARAVVRDVAHLRDPVRLMGRLMLIMGVAPILAPFMGGLLSAWQGWRAIFIFLALFAAAALLLVALLLPETHAPERRLRQRPRAILAAYAALLADGRFLRPALAAGCAIAGMFAYIAGSPLSSWRCMASPLGNMAFGSASMRPGSSLAVRPRAGWPSAGGGRCSLPACCGPWLWPRWRW